MNVVGQLLISLGASVIVSTIISYFVVRWINR